MIKYPNGQKYQIKSEKEKKTKSDISFSSANRGMSFEEDINISNEYYLSKGLCLFTKRPTPINIVKVDYSHGAKIKDAFFEKQSTTDYNGVYQGRYIDFEAKSTRNKTSFPLANIPPQQIEHLKNVIAFNGIAFFLVNFETLKKVYFIEAKDVIELYEKKERKSIPLIIFEEKGEEVKQGYLPRLDFLPIIQNKYFN